MLRGTRSGVHITMAPAVPCGAAGCAADADADAGGRGDAGRDEVGMCVAP